MKSFFARKFEAKEFQYPLELCNGVYNAEYEILRHIPFIFPWPVFTLVIKLVTDERPKGVLSPVADLAVKKYECEHPDRKRETEANR